MIPEYLVNEFKMIPSKRRKINLKVIDFKNFLRSKGVSESEIISHEEGYFIGLLGLE